MDFIQKIKKNIKIAALIEKVEQSIKFNQKKIILENNILTSCNSGINRNKYFNHDIVVSLTTYDKRLNEVHLTIESIMEQTIKANRIILWLDYSLQNATLPISLQLLVKKGLEIKYCEDIRSYKKLIPTLKLCPNDAIITIDDDALYEMDLIERFINAYKQDPTFIYCCRMHRIKFSRNKTIKKYTNWDSCCSSMEYSPLNFPVGVGGVLYPPHCFNEEVFNAEVFMDICKFADDIWFKAMGLYNGYRCKRIYTHNNKGDDFLTNPNVQDIGLSNLNVGKSLNDIQLKAVFDKYNLYNHLNL